MAIPTEVRRMRRVMLSAAILASAGIALAGCSSSAGSPPAGSSTGGSVSGGTITIAASYPLTGDSAQYGIGTQQGLKLAVDEVNSSGGIAGKQLVLKEFDDKCDATEGAQVGNRIVSDHSIQVVVGQVCSGATNAEMPVISAAGLPDIAATASNPSLTQNGWKNFSRIIPNDTVQSILLNQAAKGLGYKNIAIVYSNDDYGQQISKALKDNASKYGLNFVDEESYTPKQTSDFTPILTNVLAKHPDAVILGGYYDEMGTLVSQSPRVFGSTKIPFMGGAQEQQDGFLKLGGPASEGTMVVNLYDVTSTSPANKSFVTNFKAKYNEEPGYQAAYGYDNIYFLKKAIESNGGSLDNLSAVIRKTTYDGATGHIALDSNGDDTASSGVILTVTGGKFVFSSDLTAKLNAAAVG